MKRLVKIVIVALFTLLIAGCEVKKPEISISDQKETPAPTETQKPTEAPKATETPAPTNTPTPTEAPQKATRYMRTYEMVHSSETSLKDYLYLDYNLENNRVQFTFYDYGYNIFMSAPFDPATMRPADGVYDRKEYSMEGMVGMCQVYLEYSDDVIYIKYDFDQEEPYIETFKFSSESWLN